MRTTLACPEGAQLTVWSPKEIAAGVPIVFGKAGEPMRSDHLLYYDNAGQAHLVTASPDAPSVVSGATVTLLTLDEHNPAPSPVRLGSREIYADRPFLPTDRIRGAGAEYVHTGRLPESVAWQRRASMVPQGPFGKRLVAEDDLPPRLDWSYPRQAQPWAHDPPPLTNLSAERPPTP